jgi:hypothetical protein
MTRMLPYKAVRNPKATLASSCLSFWLSVHLRVWRKLSLDWISCSYMLGTCIEIRRHILIWLKLDVSNILFSRASRRFLGSTQFSTKRFRGDSFPEGKRPGREADHSPPSSAGFKNVRSYTFTHSYAFLAWELIKDGQIYLLSITTFSAIHFDTIPSFLL